MSAMVEKKIVTLKIDDLVPYKYNPRKNKAAVTPVAESIRQTGYNNPIVVDENNVILAGHTRRLSLIALGEKEVEVMKVTGLSEEQKKKYRLLDNKTGELASWDYVALAEELEGLDFEGLDIDWGLEQGDDFETEYVNKEFAPDNFDDEQFEYECPHCGFHFNGK